MITTLLLAVGLAFGSPDGLPAAWSMSGEAQATDTPWWHSLGDPTLTQAIEEGLADNHDLAAAWQRVRQARAGQVGAASPLAPMVSFDIGWSTMPLEDLQTGSPVASATAAATPTTSPTGGTGGTATTGATGAPTAPAVPELPELLHTGQGGLNFAWNLDITGRQVLAWRASRFDALASEGDVHAARIATATAIATVYFDTVTATQQVTLLEQQAKTQGDLLEVIELRYQGGTASALDLLQQRQAVASTRAMLPTARARRRALELQLANLLGDHQPPPVASELPNPGRLPYLGTPSDLLRTRPDLVAADRRRQAATHRHTASWLQLAPSLRATAFVGRQFTWLTDYEDDATWNVGGQMSLPLFNAGALHAGVRQAGAGKLASEHAMQQALLGATTEVESAIANDQATREQRAVTDEQAEAAQLAWESATARYLEGVEPFVTVLGAQTALANAQISQLTAHRDTLAARVALHDALGGPWATRTSP